jgi:hypothetical protein
MGFAALYPSYLPASCDLSSNPLATTAIHATKRRGRSRLLFQTKEADMRKIRDLQDLPSFQHLA